MSVNRKDLTDYLEANGWILQREGGNHTIYAKGNKKIPVMRHRSLARFYANGVCKQAGLNQKF